MFSQIKREVIEKITGTSFTVSMTTDPYALALVLRNVREDLDNLQARTDRLVRELERGE